MTATPVRRSFSMLQMPAGLAELSLPRDIDWSVKMKISLVAITTCAAIVGAMALSPPAIAQQKTVKACEDEWKANKAANQAAKITQKAYVEKCRGEAEAKPAAAAPAAAAKTPAPSEKKPAAAATATKSEKTVKECEDEWKANKAANQAKKITEKDYVEKCRAGASTAQPTSAPAASPPAATTTSAPSSTPAAAPAATTPAAAPAKTTAAAPTAATTLTGANQYAVEAQAKAHCPTATVVWANLDSKIFHFAGHADYGHTKSGAYMCENDATAQGIRAAKNEKHP